MPNQFFQQYPLQWFLSSFQRITVTCRTTDILKFQVNGHKQGSQTKTKGVLCP